MRLTVVFETASEPVELTRCTTEPQARPVDVAIKLVQQLVMQVELFVHLQTQLVLAVERRRESIEMRILLLPLLLLQPCKILVRSVVRGRSCYVLRLV